jgi:nuclease S1
VSRFSARFLGGLMAALLLSLPALAPAWGRVGHHLTCWLAEKELEPAAAEAIADLLGDETMADVSLWADVIRRERTETEPFHYVNGPRDQVVPREEDFLLPRGNVYTAVIGYAALVADESLPREERREALKFLIHFMADIHQPLHCAFADDLGGNRYPVMYNGRQINIHRVWDNEILGSNLFVDPQVGAEALYARFTDAQRAAWASAADPRTWVVESRQLVFAGIYPTLQSDVPGAEGSVGVVDDAYLSVWTPIAELQIARAGSRIAAVLNAIFVTGVSPLGEPPAPLPLLPSMVTAE